MLSGRNISDFFCYRVIDKRVRQRGIVALQLSGATSYLGSGTFISHLSSQRFPSAFSVGQAFLAVTEQVAASATRNRCRTTAAVFCRPTIPGWHKDYDSATRNRCPTGVAFCVGQPFLVGDRVTASATRNRCPTARFRMTELFTRWLVMRESEILHLFRIGVNVRLFPSHMAQSR